MPRLMLSTDEQDREQPRRGWGVKRERGDERARDEAGSCTSQRYNGGGGKRAGKKDAKGP